MVAPLVVSFRPGIALVQEGTRAIVETPHGRLPVKDLPAGLEAALQALAGDGASEAALADLVRATDGAAGLPLLYLHLRQYARLGLLRYTLAVEGEPLVVVEPMVHERRFTVAPVDAASRWRLSRFAYARRADETFVLESPRSGARVFLAGPRGAALVGALAQPCSAGELSALDGRLAESTAQALLGLLAGLDLVDAVDEHGVLAEDANPVLRQWEFHDLLFHTRSRQGRHDYAYGATFRFGDALPPLPALKPPMSEAVVPLERPDLERLMAEDVPFSVVAEQRRSVRTHGEPPIHVRELGELLYRAGRVRALGEAGDARGRRYAVTNRPYPSGGAIYDLELYVTANRCAELVEGLYHYAPLAHQLERLAGRTAAVDGLLRDAQRSAGLESSPQVLITLASRFQRRSWKYAGIAYANTLKNVGVLYQTLYLVATAMGLAPCALGYGDADLFAAAAGTDYYVESSVGEFLLGRAPSG
jgi:SagB-type dehydrogenase family enzyme